MALCVDGLAVCACGNCHGLGIVQQLIGKAFFDGLLARHIGGVAHHVQQHGFRQASLPLVDGDLALIPCIIGFRGLAEFVSIERASNGSPALVNHHKAGRIHLYRIAGAHDKTAARHGHAVHNAGQLRALGGQFTQPVVNQDGNARIAAQTVHADDDLRAVFDLLQVRQELALDDVLSRNRLVSPPVDGLRFHDFAVHGNIRGLAVSAGHCVTRPLDVHLRCVIRFGHFAYLPVS